MRYEVADSDDELDIAVHDGPVPTAPAPVDIVDPSSAAPSKLEHDPVAETDFDTFLTPTQAISSFDAANLNHDSTQPEYDIATSNLIASSTLRFLNDVAPPSSSINSELTCGSNEAGARTMGGKSGKKRSRTQIEQDEQNLNLQQHDVQSKSAKRSKKSTYGKKSTMDSGETAEFSALIAGSDKSNVSDHVQHDMGSTDNIDFPSLVSIEQRSNYTSPLDLTLSASGRVNVHEGARDRHDQAQHGTIRPVQPYTPYASYFATDMHGVTANRSSIGGYQSFSISPGELGIGYGDINPFGQLSQATDLDDADSADHRVLVAHFQNDRRNGKRSIAVDEADATMQAMQTSSVEKADLQNGASPSINVDHLPQESPSYSQLTARDGDINQNRGEEQKKADISCDMLEPVLLSDSIVQNAPKKRGRKRKQKTEDETVLLDQDNVDELHIDDTHIKRTIRAGTIDSVSNASEISYATSNSKSAKKRKAKKANVQALEELPEKLPSSDLGLDNKAVIGLSPERYVPRPSRRRVRAEPLVETVILDEEKDDSVHSPHLDLAATQNEEPAVDQLAATAKRSKGKKGRKGRGKENTSTSEVAVDDQDRDEQDIDGAARNSETGDGEVAKSEPQTLEDEREAAIDDETKVDGLDDDEKEEAVKSKKRHTRVVVDIPALPKPENGPTPPLPPVPEPKKRGRKRKKPIEEVVVEDEEESEQRPALAEKDPNIRRGASKPAKLSETKIEATADSKDCQENDENETTTETDSKSSLQPSVKPTEASAATPTPSKPATDPKEQTSATPSWQNKARIGLSKRYSIPSLLRKIDRNKEAPKIIERKEKLSKRQLEEREQERIAKEEAEAEGREYVPANIMRGADGMLMEWDF